MLVVDDDADVRECVAEVLSDEGHRVYTAANGRDALGVLRDDGVRPDLIVLDMMMPVMDGWEFRAEQLRTAELAEIPVIVFTAHAVADDAANALQAVAFLRKPLRLDALLAAVAGVPPATTAKGEP